MQPQTKKPPALKEGSPNGTGLTSTILSGDSYDGGGHVDASKACPLEQIALPPVVLDYCQRCLQEQ